MRNQEKRKTESKADSRPPFERDSVKAPAGALTRLGLARRRSRSAGHQRSQARDHRLSDSLLALARLEEPLIGLELDPQILPRSEGLAQVGDEPVRSAQVGEISSDAKLGFGGVERMFPAAAEGTFVAPRWIVEESQVGCTSTTAARRREAVHSHVNDLMTLANPFIDPGFDRLAMWEVVSREDRCALCPVEAPGKLRPEPRVADRSV